MKDGVPVSQRGDEQVEKGSYKMLEKPISNGVEIRLEMSRGRGKDVPRDFDKF